MLKVYIADDEEAVRQGLKKIIDWQSLDFEVCGEAADGLSAYHDIIKLNPHLVLLDIRMPKMQGLELAKGLRENNFEGSIIILSGYSEFRYAQEAIKFDVKYYLTKPIDEEELHSCVLEIKQLILEQETHNEHMYYYQEKASDKILEDIIKLGIDLTEENIATLDDLGLTSEKYQILILDSEEKNKDPYLILLKRLNLPYSTNILKNILVDGINTVLLKNSEAIDSFKSYASSHKQEDGASFFIAMGPVVSSINEINLSYKSAKAIAEKRFFLNKEIHIASGDDLAPSEKAVNSFSALDSKELGKRLYDLIAFFKKTECEQFLSGLKVDILNSRNSVDSLKSVLAGMYIFIVQEIKKTYVNYDAEFLTNAEIIQWFHSCDYLQDIIDFLKLESKRLIRIIGGYSSESIVDEIAEYVKHHYGSDVKLKTLAPKFGYNSSYLGKIFSKKTGISFNDYLHKIRTEKAKELLLNKKYKIYEISSLVGYKNVDYFHLKFKQHEGTTPNEYRTANNIDVE